MMQLLAGAGPGQGQRVPGKSWSRPRLWPSSCAMEEATPRMLVEWSCGGGELRSTLVLSPRTSWAPSRHHLPPQLLPEESPGLGRGKPGFRLASVPLPPCVALGGDLCSLSLSCPASGGRPPGRGRHTDELAI